MFMETRAGSLFSWRYIFFASIILKAYFSLSLSYIHPDEHFQGPEAIADEVFGWATRKTWEFTSEMPIRSYLPLWISYGVPMAIYDFLFGGGKEGTIRPLSALYALRICFTLFYWILGDMAVDRLMPNKTEKTKALFFIATSYVTWTYQSHTFSNSSETVILLWCLVIIHELCEKESALLSRHRDCILLGCFIVYGIFNRVTFVAYLFLPSFTLLKYFGRYPSTFVSFAFAGFFMTILMIHIDTMHYKSSSYVITPLNSLLYNLDSSNLAKHGLHPRIHHLTANLPELLGPAILLLFSKNYIRTLPFQSAISGIVLLSIPQHQEARFLLPAIPLLLCCLDFTTLPPYVIRVVLIVWYSFNVFMGIMMGLFHQAGVIPAQEFISQYVKDNGNSINGVIYWQTYSPPIWLLGMNKGSVSYLTLNEGSDDEVKYAPIYDYLDSYNSSANQDQLVINDLMGCSALVLDHIFEIISRQSNPMKSFLFVAPIASVSHNEMLQDLISETTLIDQGTSQQSIRLEKVWSTFFHLGLDNFDISDISTFQPGLGVWKIQYTR
ncbi:hypothetical protein NADFUDRAFT_83640 [Nadsonia fulvescens var. elongata DSM 6958]|uniref:Mannosyltransferase n=1 Tax=Nadsonia fulvescens var. elongata DSM 6958 TaxID=857566 RepID=A0A1E3PH47_9ASCO|nr:hypothetical protein NADFUDRAFT_83640 [Nadsonia fulvescens var. elongata DSM 6958]